MVYFQARSDLQFMAEFREKVVGLLNYETKAANEHQRELSRRPFGVTKNS